jgi:hypothetical protein
VIVGKRAGFANSTDDDLGEQNRRGPGIELGDGKPGVGTGAVGSTERLGGPHRHHHRAA